MDGVLDSASVLCVFKLVSNLLCLPSLATSRSPVGFCGCCILIFTDFLLTVYLSFLGLFESWLVELIPPVGVIALHFLLFLSHTYGAVLILSTPLVAVETFGKFLWMTREEEEDDDEDDDEEDDEGREEKSGWQSPAIGYLCCLSVWVSVALSLRCGWRLEEARATACLASGGSLMRCLPNLLSPLPGAMRPCWGVALLYLILILLTCSLLLLTQAMASDSRRCSSKENVCTAAPLRMPRRNRWRGSDLALALLAVLGILVLPLYLGVNVLLLRSVETLLEACISFFLASVSRGSGTDVVTLV